jgi:hypothetical protein
MSQAASEGVVKFQDLQIVQRGPDYRIDATARCVALSALLACA